MPVFNMTAEDLQAAKARIMRSIVLSKGPVAWLTYQLRAVECELASRRAAARMPAA